MAGGSRGAVRQELLAWLAVGSGSVIYELTAESMKWRVPCLNHALASRANLLGIYRDCWIL